MPLSVTTMRPEGTAPVVRALQAHRAALGEWPVRVFYIGPMFRHERPQKGRLRQFHQFGAEMFGTDSPLADAEVLTFLHRLVPPRYADEAKLFETSVVSSLERAIWPSARESLTFFSVGSSVLSWPFSFSAIQRALTISRNACNACVAIG